MLFIPSLLSKLNPSKVSSQPKRQSLSQDSKVMAAIPEETKIEEIAVNNNVEPSIELILPSAFVIKNILTIDEQIELYEAIISTSKVCGKLRPLSKINKNKKYERIMDINIGSTDIREKAKHAKLDIFDKYINKVITFVRNSNEYNQTGLAAQEQRQQQQQKQQKQKQTQINNQNNNNNNNTNNNSNNTNQKNSENNGASNENNNNNNNAIANETTITATETEIEKEGNTIIESSFDYNFIKAQEYFVPNGYIFKHCDNVKGWVILFSIGCEPEFYITNDKLKNNNNETGDQLIDFKSGNVLLFDAGRTAKIFHRIDSIKEGTCPIKLSSKFERLLQTRIGLQIRTRFYSSVKNKSKFQQL